MSEWQPIETAPKDGEDFLALFLFDDGSFRYDVSRWCDARELFTAGRPFEEDTQPTHWMPLPEPPKDPS